MIRIIGEIVLAVLLAVFATLAFVKSQESSLLAKELSTLRKSVAEARDHVAELEAELEKQHAAAAGGKDHTPHWGYEGDVGPAHWGDNFPTCGSGTQQSPVDIKGPFEKAAQEIVLNYRPVTLRLLNNGHTIQVNAQGAGSMSVGGVSYELLQFHFHRPSEETVNGKHSAMVVHFVHKSADGKLAVIGLLLNEGSDNAVLKTIWSKAPPKEGPEAVFEAATISPAALLPKSLNFYSYSGSLTTPPCTEGVTFFILRAPGQIPREQVEAFPFKLNARPVQPLNGRKILAN